MGIYLLMYTCTYVDPILVTKRVLVPLWPRMFSATGLCKCNKNNTSGYYWIQNTERTSWLISIHGDKNSYQEYLATLCKIIIKLNKVTTIDVRDGSVGST